MVFTCRQCGECCISGLYCHRATARAFEFACESVSTGTPFTACIDEDKLGIFSDCTFPDAHPHACRFLRPDGKLLRSRSTVTARPSASSTGAWLCGSLILTGSFVERSPGPSTIRKTQRSGHSGRAEKEIPESCPDAEERRAEFLTSHGYRVE